MEIILNKYMHREAKPVKIVLVSKDLTIGLAGKWNNPLSIFGTFHYQLWGYQNKNLEFASEQYRAFWDCTICLLAWLYILVAKANRFLVPAG